MHPDNIKASRYVLFEEILPDRSLEDILLSPQKEPYYEPVDTIHDDPGLDDEYLAIAAELNKDIPYFRRNQDRCRASRASERLQRMAFRQKRLLQNMKQLNQKLSQGAGGAAAGAAGAAGGFTGGLRNMSPDMKKTLGKSAAKGAAATAAKEVGRGLLRGLFRK